MATDLDTPLERPASVADGDAALPTGSPGRVAALVGWARAHPARAGAALLGCVVVFGAATTFTLRAFAFAGGPASYQTAFEALQAGAYAKAAAEAQVLIARGFAPTDEPGGAYFVAGAALFRQTDMSWAADRRDAFLLAAGYLQNASERGLTPEREGQCLLMLGKARLFAGDVLTARQALQAAATLLPDGQADQADLRLHLAQTYLYQPTPDFDRALEENTLCLASVGLAPALRGEAELQRAEILLHLRDVEAARKALAQATSPDIDSAKASLLRGQFFMREGDRVKQEANSVSDTPSEPSSQDSTAGTMPSRERGEDTDTSRRIQEATRAYQRAIESFHDAARRDGQRTVVSRTAQFLAGRCFQQIGDYDKAVEQYLALADLYAGSSESIGAIIFAAEIAIQQGDLATAMSRYRRALRLIADGETYVNAWLPLDEIRNRLARTYHDFSDRRQYALALELLDSAESLLSPVDVARWQGETLSAWARQCAERAQTALPNEAAQLTAESRTHYRAAGEAYRRLAGLEYTTRAYTDNLWLSAECFRLAQDSEATADMLQWYLQHNVSRRQPRALLNLGEALVNLARYDAALTVLNECVTLYPTDPVAYQARLVASRAHWEKGNIEHAEQLLIENLNGYVGIDEPSGFLAPSSIEWRESLFALAQLQKQEQRFDEAIKSFVKYIHYANRYDQGSPRLPETHYLLGQCYLRLRSRHDDTPQSAAPSVRSTRALEDRKLLEQALREFLAARDALKRKLEEHADLSPHDGAVLRNCYLLIGGILIDLGQYREAIREYQAAVGRYQNSPEALTIYVEIARAYRLVGEPTMARGAIQSAQTLLALLRENGAFRGTTDHSLDEWNDLLRWQSKL